MLQTTTRQHFDRILSLPHADKPPAEPGAWYATDDNKIVAELSFDSDAQRWLGVLYANTPDGWLEFDHGGEGYFDLDDAERALLSEVARLEVRAQAAGESR